MTDLRLAPEPPEAPPADRLLKPEDAATLLEVEVRWLYRHHKEFTFTRKLSRKVLRFHEAGLREYIEKGIGKVEP